MYSTALKGGTQLARAWNTPFSLLLMHFRHTRLRWGSAFAMPCLCASVRLESPVFVKQLAHSTLELLVGALFPELKGAILEIRQSNL